MDAVTDGDSDVGSAYQYEVLAQHLAPSSSGAYLITQSHGQDPRQVALSADELSPDHIIVQTLPNHQVRFRRIKN